MCRGLFSLVHFVHYVLFYSFDKMHFRGYYVCQISDYQPSYGHSYFLSGYYCLARLSRQPFVTVPLERSLVRQEKQMAGMNYLEIVTTKYLDTV